MELTRNCNITVHRKMRKYKRTINEKTIFLTPKFLHLKRVSVFTSTVYPEVTQLVCQAQNMLPLDDLQSDFNQLSTSEDNLN